MSCREQSWKKTGQKRIERGRGRWKTEDKDNLRKV
jgi:hypothetical protein